MDESHVVDPLPQIGKQIGNPLAGLSPLVERPGTLHQIAILALKGNEFFFSRQWLPVAFLKLGLVVESVQLGASAGEKDLDDASRLGSEMRSRLRLVLLGSQKTFSVEQRYQRYRTESPVHLV